MLKIQKCVATFNSDMAENENARADLYSFLESKDQYNATQLSEEVQKHPWMDKELILLLVKEKKFDAAIEKYLQNDKFAEAEEFCASHSQQDGLLTKLLEKYFEKYEDYVRVGEVEKMIEYKRRAHVLMQQNSSSGLLDP